MGAYTWAQLPGRAVRHNGDGLMRLARRGSGETGIGRGFIALCALVLALCVAHQLLMASERHAAVMESAPARAAAAEGRATPFAALLDGVGVPGPEMPPGMPIPLMGDCPAQQAIVPALLLLDLLLGVAIWGGGPPVLLGADPVRPRMHGRTLAPPLSPVRRQALLHVFRI